MISLNISNLLVVTSVAPCTWNFNGICIILYAFSLHKKLGSCIQQCAQEVNIL